jgi:hypothetical protein
MGGLKFYRKLKVGYKDISILEISLQDFLPNGCHLVNSSLPQNVEKNLKSMGQEG